MDTLNKVVVAILCNIYDNLLKYIRLSAFLYNIHYILLADTWYIFLIRSGKLFFFFMPHFHSSSKNLILLFILSIIWFSVNVCILCVGCKWKKLFIWFYCLVKWLFCQRRILFDLNFFVYTKIVNIIFW